MSLSAKSACSPWAKPEGCLRLFLGGDVMTGRGIDQLFAVHNDDDFGKPDHIPARNYLHWSAALHGAEMLPLRHDYIWGAALGVLDLADPDFRLVNLETAITTSADWQKKQYNFRMHPANVACLTTAGIDCCTLANNHALDFGVAGMQETLRVLQAAGIAGVGAGSNLDEAQHPHIRGLPDGQRLLVFAWGGRDSHIVFADWAAEPGKPGINLLGGCGDDDAQRMVDTVNAWRRPGDIVIISLHWGANWASQVPVKHRALARYLIDQAGVDIIHGHSSHHVLPMEIYRGKPILYGCGDLINDMEGKPEYRAQRGYLGALYLIDIDLGTRRLAGVRIQPVQRRRFRLELPSAEDARWVLGCLGKKEKAIRDT